jgi:MFS family permease
MSIDTEKPGGTWRELLGPGHVGTSTVLAGGVALHAINIFLTTSLLPTAIGDIGGELVPFVVGAVVCAVSPTMVALLCGRALQGIGGGILAGLGYAVVQAVLPERLWAKATALVSAMWGVGTLAGPAVGGVFAQFDSWRLAFVVLAVLGAFVAVLAWRVLPRSARSAATEPIPFVSLALLTATTAVISVAGLLERASHLVVAGLVAVLLLYGFVVRERRGPARVLPATTYSAASPLMWLYLSVAILATGTATEAFTPLFGQRLAGLDPLLAGFLGAAVSLGWSTSMVLSANVTDAPTVRRLRALGPAVLATGLAVTGLTQWTMRARPRW